jgi:hypothetical protein
MLGHIVCVFEKAPGGSKVKEIFRTSAVPCALPCAGQKVKGISRFAVFDYIWFWGSIGVMGFCGPIQEAALKAAHKCADQASAGVFFQPGPLAISLAINSELGCCFSYHILLPATNWCALILQPRLVSNVKIDRDAAGYKGCSATAGAAFQFILQRTAAQRPR